MNWDIPKLKKLNLQQFSNIERSNFYWDIKKNPLQLFLASLLNLNIFTGKLSLKCNILKIDSGSRIYSWNKSRIVNSSTRYYLNKMIKLLAFLSSQSWACWFNFSNILQWCWHHMGGDAQIPGYRHSSLSKPHVYSNFGTTNRESFSRSFSPRPCIDYEYFLVLRNYSNPLWCMPNYTLNTRKKVIKITIKANNAFNRRSLSSMAWPMFSPIEFSFLFSGSGMAQAGMQTSYACQGDKLDLVCPQGTVIRVMRANYGRFSVGICNEHGITDWSVNCMAPRSLRILQDRYNDGQDGFDDVPRVPQTKYDDGEICVCVDYHLIANCC